MNGQVGIFEIIDDNIYYRSRDVDFSKEKDIISDDAGEFFHQDLVKSVIQNCSLESKEKYKSTSNGFLFCPRGRVSYNFECQKFQVCSCRRVITNKELISKIMSLFNLRREETVICIDAFYELD